MIPAQAPQASLGPTELQEMPRDPRLSAACPNIGTSFAPRCPQLLLHTQVPCGTPGSPRPPTSSLLLQKHPHQGLTLEGPPPRLGSQWGAVAWVGALAEVPLLPRGPGDPEEPKPHQRVSVCVLGALAGKGSAAVIEAGGMRGMLQNSGRGVPGGRAGISLT